MRTRPSSSELPAWSLVGLGLGLVSGIALAGWLGPTRARGTTDEREPASTSGPPSLLRGSEAERAVERVLQRDTDLSGLELHALAVGPGVVELHGWVSTRPLRTRAMRLAAQVHGIETLVNCLLVHGEDDPARPALDATDQSA